ncbi:MAG: hypothetical protein WAZ34_08055 [Rhodocyclaceae bacterium]
MHPTKTFLGAIVASLLLTLPAYAHDMNRHAPAADNKAPTLQKMQANVKKMQAQLARIGKAKNDEVRHQLVADHLQTLRDNMMLAQEIVGDSCPMMEHGKEGGKAMHGQGMHENCDGMAGRQGTAKAEHCDAMTGRMQPLEKRIETMAPAVQPATPAPGK